MATPAKNSHPNAVDWSAFFEGDVISLRDRYTAIVYQIGIESYGKEHPDEPMPEPSDDEIAGLREGIYPAWWPKSYPRLQVRIKIVHAGVTHVYGPSFFEVRRLGAGWDSAQNIMKLLMSTAPNPFLGSMLIEFLLPSGMSKGGYNGTVKIGSGNGVNGVGTGSDDEPWIGTENAYLRKMAREKDEKMLRMFEGASSIISSSASVIAATKGTNDEKEGGDWKEALIEVGAGIAMKFFGTKEDEEEKDKKKPPQIPERRPAPQLTDHNYPSEVDPAGPPSARASDGWGEDDVEDAETVPEPLDAEIDAEDDDEEEAPSSDNPLDGMDPDELGRHLEDWIAKNKDNKKEIKKMGMKLAKHVL